MRGRARAHSKSRMKRRGRGGGRCCCSGSGRALVGGPPTEHPLPFSSIAPAAIGSHVSFERHDTTRHCDATKSAEADPIQRKVAPASVQRVAVWTFEQCKAAAGAEELYCACASVLLRLRVCAEDEAMVAAAAERERGEGMSVRSKQTAVSATPKKTHTSCRRKKIELGDCSLPVF